MSTSSPTLQVCRECGGGAPVDVHFCPQCTKILSLGRHGDYYDFLGLPRKLTLDSADLERRFRDLSRQFHPDYFYNATAAERRASLERSSYLNDAYRTLKNPVTRVEYLLKLEGLNTSASATPPGLLEEVFALNEELDEIRSLRASGAAHDQLAARLERARRPIEQKRDEHEQDVTMLAAKWDATGDRLVLEALRDRVLERNYITNLLDGIEREMNQ
jgi:molecular chaperone HscB